MQNTNTILSDAINTLKDISIASAQPKVLEIEVEDHGTKRKVPVVIITGPDGKPSSHLLIDSLAKATAFVREQRLLSADGPDARTGVASHQSIDSFIAHADRFKGEGSAIWANAARRELVSVLDYHMPGVDGSPRWGRHRGTYACPLSEAWKAWGGGAQLTLSQEEFASLLDARDRELVGGTLPNGSKAPDPSFLVTLATNLEVYSSASAKRERDPQTGRVRIAFSEESGVIGAVQPPPSFLVKIPVFEDRDPRELEVRLRVTVDKGHAQFTLGIHSAADVLRNEFDELCALVANSTALPLFVGTPE